MKQENYLKRLKKLSYPKLSKRAWRVWSLKRRKEACDSRGFISCITCGILKPYKEIELGHFVHGKLDFKRENTNPQCTRCNRFLHGNLGKYAIWLDKRYGIGTAESLIKMGAKEKPRPYSTEELINIINEKN
jgi:hypothetical protein